MLNFVLGALPLNQYAFEQLKIHCGGVLKFGFGRDVQLEI